MKRWAIWIDIEGFSRLYLQDDWRALVPLGALLEGIYKIGSTVCSESPNRLFAHQTGDGVVIVSECAQGSPHLPLAIAAALLRTVLASGGVAKAGISEGEFADIQGCYPDIIWSAMENHGTIKMGHGVLRIFPVMGSALVNAYALTKKLTGGLLLVDGPLATSLPAGVVVSKRESDYAVIDWVHFHTPELDDISANAHVSWPENPALETRLRDYALKTRPSPCQDWTNNTLELNHCLQGADPPIR